MSESRRRFLKEIGCMTLGAGASLPLLDLRRWQGEAKAAGEAAAQVAEQAAFEDRLQAVAPIRRQWAMVVDIEKCMNPAVRRACGEACRREHNIPDIPDPEEVIHWIWSERYEHVFADQVHRLTPQALLEAPVPVLCNHCSEPPCVKVCPTGATWKRADDGVVMMDMHRCIGCRYCMAACPFGARSFNWRDPRPWVEKTAQGRPVADYPTRTKGVVEKCTFCAERLREGRPPACVEAAAEVPGGDGALTFGDLSDPDSEVRRVLSRKNTLCRRVALGTGPNVFYVVPREVADGSGATAGVEAAETPGGPGAGEEVAS